MLTFLMRLAFFLGAILAPFSRNLTKSASVIRPVFFCNKGGNSYSGQLFAPFNRNLAKSASVIHPVFFCNKGDHFRGCILTRGNFGPLQQEPHRISLRNSSSVSSVTEEVILEARFLLGLIFAPKTGTSRNKPP